MQSSYAELWLSDPEHVDVILCLIIITNLILLEYFFWISYLTGSASKCIKLLLLVQFIFFMYFLIYLISLKISLHYFKKKTTIKSVWITSYSDFKKQKYYLQEIKLSCQKNFWNLLVPFCILINLLPQLLSYLLWLLTMVLKF